MPSAVTVACLSWALASFAVAEIDCAYSNLIGGAASWFGEPNYSDCHKLIFGDNDLSGIAAIDAWSHAFIQAGASREQESNTEWANRVVLPKFWGNAGCKIALMPVESVYDHRVERDTGQWLPIAESAQAVNNVCVAGEHSGGMDETGDNKRLLISLYQPGSPQDRNIEDARRHGEQVTMPIIRDEDENSIDDDLNALQDHFTSLLNIHEDPDYPQPRATWERDSGYFHVGESDPQVKNLGNNWELRYNSVTSLLPTTHAANGLSSFYLSIVKKAAENIASNATSLKSLNFRLNDLSLILNSPAPIPWEWIVRFARGMLQASIAGWTILYDASARNAYWDVAAIDAALKIISTAVNIIAHG